MELLNLVLKRLRNDLTNFVFQVEQLQLQLVEVKKHNNKKIIKDYNSKEEFKS